MVPGEGEIDRDITWVRGRIPKEGEIPDEETKKAVERVVSSWSFELYVCSFLNVILFLTLVTLVVRLKLEKRLMKGKGPLWG